MKEIIEKIEAELLAKNSYDFLKPTYYGIQLHEFSPAAVLQIYCEQVGELNREKMDHANTLSLLRR